MVHAGDDESRHAPPHHPGPAVYPGPGAAVHPNLVRLSATEAVSAAKPTLRRQSELRHCAEDDRSRHPGEAGARLHGMDELGAGKFMSPYPQTSNTD